MKTRFALFFLLTSVLSFDLLDEKSSEDQDIGSKTMNEILTDANDKKSFMVVTNEDYWEKCIGYNEDSTLNFTGLTTKYGYPTESHTVTTDDDYILTIFRIIKGKKCNSEIKRTPVIIMHGLTTSSDDFIISGPDAALGYLVADACYDVWLPNHRGNRYSREHVYLTADPHSEKYWNFTYDEHGMYDLKAIVNYVLEATDSEKLSYIGHSQGTTDFYVLTSTLPEYNAKFTVAISLGPIAWLSHLKSPLFRLLFLALPEIQASLDLLQIREVFRREDPTDKIFEFLCQFLPEEFCGLVIMIAAGGDPRTIGSEVFKTFSGHNPCAASTKNLFHIGQGANINKFRRYDYGTEGNLEVYGSDEPPEYDVTKITAPVALFASRGDLLSTIEDVATLKAKLPNVVHYSEFDEFWGHLHFPLAKMVPTKLAPTVFELLDSYGS